MMDYTQFTMIASNLGQVNSSMTRIMYSLESIAKSMKALNEKFGAVEQSAQAESSEAIEVEEVLGNERT